MPIIFKTYADITHPHHITLEQALERITGRSKDKILAIRSKVFTGEDYSDDKKGLPFVVFSAERVEAVASKKGYQTYREDECVKEHSGVFIVDFDKCNVEQKMEQLKRDPYSYAVWLGPSGTGVKALVKCPKSVEKHSLYYNAYLDRYPDADSTSKNISRGTYESYDENLWVNEGSLVWDKTLTEEQARKNKEKNKNKRSTKVLATAAAMIRASYDGTRHDTLLKAANLLGGYVASGRVQEEEAFKLLEGEFLSKDPSPSYDYKKTIQDGLDNGKVRPLYESKKIEKAQEFLRREDGTYDFLADDQEMTEYELAVINGDLEMGLPTGLNGLNEWWMFKKNHLVWFAGVDNVGKSFLVWYLAVLAAILHGWKFLIYSSENRDGQLRKKLKEFYLGKSIKIADDEELTWAHDFVREHFRIMTAKQMHTVEDMLLKAEIVYDEGFEFDCFIAEPYNSFDIPIEMDSHRHNIYSLNRLRVFKENYSSVWVCDHVGTTSARNRDKDGFVKTPWKSDVDGGQIKANKVDDFIIIHRLVNHPLRKFDMEFNVLKVKDKETGGHPTMKDEPVVLQIEQGYCGYTCDGQDPVQEYWQRKQI